MNDFSTVLISILGFSYVAAFILIVATWTTNDNNLYSSVLGVSTLFRELNIHVSRWKVTLVAGVLATAFGAMGVINIFVPFLSLLCVLIPPFASVMVVDYFFHKTDYDYAKAGAIPSLRKHTLASAVIGCLVGLSMNTPPVGFGIPFMVQLSGVVPTALAAMATALAADAIFEAAGRKA